MQDKRFVGGVIASAVWLGVTVGVLIVGERPDGLNEWGDFCAGFVAPLAFLWLVLGYRQQGEELKSQASELRESVRQQLELVLTMKEQNRLQREALDAAEQRRRASFQPSLELHYLGSHHTSFYKRMRCSVVNTGGTAYDVTVEVDSAGARMDSSIARNEIPRDDRANLDFDVEYQSGAKIRLAYRDEEGVAGVQVATVYLAGEEVGKLRRFHPLRTTVVEA